MAIYILNGTDKELNVPGRYASVKNNGTETVYASSTPNLDLEAAEVVPIQAGESVVVRDCKKKLYVRGSGQIAVISGNEPFNFFKSTPKKGVFTGLPMGIDILEPIKFKVSGSDEAFEGLIMDFDIIGTEQAEPKALSGLTMKLDFCPVGNYVINPVLMEGKKT